MLPEQRLAISSGTFFLKNIVHLKVKFGHFVQLVAPTDQWLAKFYVSNYSTPVNFKKKAEIWRQILRYTFSVFLKLVIFHLANPCRILNKESASTFLSQKTFFKFIAPRGQCHNLIINRFGTTWLVAKESVILRKYPT